MTNYLEMPKPIWCIEDLPPLKTGYLTAFKALPGLKEYIAHRFGFVTWHWGMIGQPHPADMFSGPDWSHGESIEKGVARTLLSQYQNRHMRIYVPDLPDGEIDNLAPSIMKRLDYYGKAGYDWLGAANIGLWFMLRHFGIKWWMKKDMRFWCLELLYQIWADFDFPICDMAEPANPINFENSPQLRLAWGTF